MSFESVHLLEGDGVVDVDGVLNKYKTLFSCTTSDFAHNKVFLKSQKINVYDLTQFFYESINLV